MAMGRTPSALGTAGPTVCSADATRPVPNAVAWRSIRRLLLQRHLHDHMRNCLADLGIAVPRARCTRNLALAKKRH
eukprot:4612660-Prorocentrum_lima.AAC.1